MSEPAPTPDATNAAAAAATAASAAAGEVSKSAQKRAAKQAEKEKSKAAKEAAKPASAAGSAAPKTKKAADDDEEVDPDAYYQNRLKDMEALKARGKSVYPHKFQVSMSIPQFEAQFSAQKIASGEKLTQEISLAGRVSSKRSSGTSLYFYVIQADNGQIQVVADKRIDSDDFEIHTTIRRGDIIGVRGVAGRSNTGELSIFPSSTALLSPCLRMLPSKVYGLKDQETRYRQRYLDLMLNQQNRKNFYTRSKIINFIRRFLDERGFLEVETPMMNAIPGGAAARPFKTYHNDLDLDMFMRIAPELYLKQLVVGGLDRVYELGRQFRNEGIDLTHNPEFTSVEFYWAYQDYEDLIKVTEEMLSNMVLQINGSYIIKYQPDPSVPMKEVNFQPPWKRINMLEGLDAAMNVTIPRDLYSKEANKFLSDCCEKHEVKCPEPRTTARLLDKLVGKFLEDGIVNPTFICEHPEIMSPLAKTHRTKIGVTERFELFCLEKELCNAYTELNNPLVQRARFADQLKDKENGDDEAQQLDEDFVRALEHGLPPTAGWGLGIDRMTMFLTNTDNIKEVLLFPAMKPDENLNAAKSSAVAVEEKSAAEAKAEAK